MKTSTSKAITRGNNLLQTTLKRMHLRSTSKSTNASNPSSKSSNSSAETPNNRSSREARRKTTKKTIRKTTNAWDRKREEKRDRPRFLDAQRRRRHMKESPEEEKDRKGNEAVSRWWRRGDGPACVTYTTQ
ncbi:MAG: hypothetical protein L6R41_004117 [Letrouitia leprolyta]|nr:MAG: hypothetical protein L6R41_004117 [Letrouitia leprolyta]